MAALYADLMKRIKKVITSSKDRTQADIFVGRAGNDIMSLDILGP